MLAPTEHKIYKIRPYIVNYAKGTIKIPLLDLHLNIRMYAKADLDLAPILLQYRYSALKGKRKTVKVVYYARSSKAQMMHQIVIDAIAPDGCYIDHKKGKTLDNRRIKIRFATFGQNNQNKPKKPGCSSQYIGVSLDKKMGKWISRIRLNNCSYYLGYFVDEINAARVYDAHAILFYGKDAKTNELLDPVMEHLIITKGIHPEWMLNSGRRVLPFLAEITRNPDGRYPVNLKHGKLVIDEEVDTLAEYLELKEEFKAEQAKSTPITRNSRGIAVVRANHKGYIIEACVDDEIWRDIGCHTFTYYEPYMYISIKGLLKLLHIYLYVEYVGDIPKGHTIDHIKSECPLDNRLENLRTATKSLQNHNQRKRNAKIDKYKGVNYMKGRFHAFVDHKSHGVYETAEEAAEHANRLFFEKYGNNARFNVIDYTRKTTKDNRIPDEMITLDFILDLKFIKDLRDVAVRKGLNRKAGGPLRTADMVSENFEWFKLEVARLLFHVNFAGHTITPPVRKQF